MSLAHNGVLFLDEIAEFSRASLEALREPLEEGRIRRDSAEAAPRPSRRGAARRGDQPVPCGYLGDPVRACACSPAVIASLPRHLSGPLLDRIDLHVEVPRLRVEELRRRAPPPSDVRRSPHASRGRARSRPTGRRRPERRLNATLPERRLPRAGDV